MEYFPSPDHLRHASHPLDKDHTSGRRRESATAFRPPSTRIPAGTGPDPDRDTNRNPGRTKVGLPTRTPTTSPRKDARKARKRPKKGPKRPRRARPAGPHKAQRKGQRRPPKATRNPPPPAAAAAGANQQPANRKKGPERPTGGHGQGQRCRTTAPPQRPRKGQRKARERPPPEAQPRAAFGCRVVSKAVERLALTNRGSVW